MNLGYLLMSGGQSSRMGQPKALLPLCGETMHLRIARAGSAFAERIFSVNDPSIPTPPDFLRVEDIYPGCGPMAGLHASLLAASADALVVAPCDSPFYTAETAAWLAAQLEEGVDAIIPEDDTGRAHPLLGVYARTCLPALEEHLRTGRYKLMQMLDGLNTRRVRLPAGLDQRVFSNLNTYEDYEAIRRAFLAEGVERIIREAGRIILSFGAYRVEEKEGHANFVTSVDCAVQEYLARELPLLLPGSAFIGEEQENDVLTDAPTWIIDPVDGTTNLIHDFHHSAVSIALVEHRQPVLAAVYQPYTDELFTAEKGCGAKLNGQPMRVSGHDFAHALVGFGTSPYHAELAERSMRMALAFLQSAADIRRSGSAALDLAYVACGRVDVFFEINLKPWDYAAGALLVTEAGGEFTMPFGDGEVRFDQPQGVLAANPLCIGDALRVVQSM